MSLFHVGIKRVGCIENAGCLSHKKDLLMVGGIDSKSPVEVGDIVLYSLTTKRPVQSHLMSGTGRHFQFVVVVICFNKIISAQNR